MDDTLLNGNWWRDVMKCRVRVDFSWNDMTFRGYMNGLGESSGSWYDKGDEDCVRGEWSMVSCGSLPSKDSLPESWIGYVFVESSKEEFVIVEFIKSASLVRYATLSPQQNQTNAFECTIGVFREELRTNRLEFIREARSRREKCAGSRSISVSVSAKICCEEEGERHGKRSRSRSSLRTRTVRYSIQTQCKYKNLEQYVDKERVTKKVKTLSYDSKTLILRDDEEDIPFQDAKDADRVLTFLKSLCQNKIKFVLTIDGTAFDPRRARKQQEEQRKQ